MLVLVLVLVPSELWTVVEPEPPVPLFATRVQDGGTVSIEARAVFTVIVYVGASGCAR